MIKKSDHPENKNQKSVWKEVGPYINMGYQLMVTIGLGVLIGWWIDKTYNTGPTYLVIFSLVFSAAALYSFIRTALGNDKKKKK